jgi:hypothetical protein
MSFTAASLLGSVAAVEVGAGVATGAVESKTAGVEVVVVGEVVVVVVVVAVAVTCHISATGSAGCDGGIVSGSCSSSEARNLAIAFRARSGNGPDRVCTQFCSMCASCVSIFSTVFISFSVSVNVAEYICVGVVVVGAGMGAAVVS